MGWWNSLKSSPSSSCVSSPSDPNQPRLTRQRKVRGRFDTEVWNFSEEGGWSKDIWSVSARSTPVSRSQSSLDAGPPTCRSDSSPSLFPQPLPLPGHAVATGFRDVGLSGGLPLPSPRGLRQNGFSGAGDEGNGNWNWNGDLSPGFVVEPMGEKLHPISVVGSKWAYATTPKSPERFELPAVVTNASHRRTMFQYSNTNEADLMLNIPARSAPTSGFNSPLLSPRRLSSGDIFSSGYLTSQAPQTRSGNDFSEFIRGFHSQPWMENWFSNLDHSTILSPTARSYDLRSKNLSAPSSPLHPRMFPENIGWHDSHSSVNVHPLPLPPGAPTQIPPPFVHQLTTNTEASAMGNQWKRGKLIGSGTFGSVYLATNRNTGALCAMKEVNLIPDDPKSAECIKQLQQEIKFLSYLKHSNIVQYYGSEMIADRFYIYLEYVYPGSIDKYVRDHFGAITESVVRSFTRHILTGLAYLHSKNAIHRDIKGANLLVNSNGIVKLADFGMSKHLSEASITYSMMGTPYWMAPEVLQASMDKESGYDSAVDIWSLGCTVIQMFTGNQPWSDLPPAAAMFKVLHESPHLPEALSFEGKDFLMRCFRRNPAERPSASELLDHPFVTTSSHQYNDIHSSVQAFAEMSLSDDSHSPVNCTMYRSDPVVKGKLMPNCSETIPAHLDGAYTPIVIRHSPELTLEAVSNVSQPHSNIQDAFSSLLGGHSSNAMHGVQHWNAGKPWSSVYNRFAQKEILHSP